MAYRENSPRGAIPSLERPQRVLLLVLLAILLTGCSKKEDTYIPGCVGAAIYDQHASVHVYEVGNAVGRLAFSDIKYNYREDDGVKTLELNCDVLRKHSDDESKSFTLTVSVDVSGKDENFDQPLSGNNLSLNQLTKLKGGVPLKIKIKIKDEI